MKFNKWEKMAEHQKSLNYSQHVILNKTTTSMAWLGWTFWLNSSLSVAWHETVTDPNISNFPSSSIQKAKLTQEDDFHHMIRDLSQKKHNVGCYSAINAQSRNLEFHAFQVSRNFGRKCSQPSAPKIQPTITERTKADWMCCSKRQLSSQLSFNSSIISLYCWLT